MTRVGVFDSGFGGLTVLRDLLPRLPGVEFLYLGDTARLPYGSKSQETIARYACSAAKFLEDSGAQYLVIACNTASALALPELRAAARVPVLGVIETGATAAKEATTSGDVLVIATEATVASGAYSAALSRQGLRAHEMACPLLVPLVEEGWQDHAVTRQVVDVYLAQAWEQARAAGLTPDVLLLGCTHYPLLRQVLEAALPGGIRVVDAAATTAERVAADLGDSRSEPGEAAVPPVFFATDSVTKFQRMGSRFLGQPIGAVRHVRFPE